MHEKEYKGKLIAKVAGVGTKSEGPEYYLELLEPNEFGQKELGVGKDAHMWEKDEKLHPFVNKMVVILGEQVIVKHTTFEGTEKVESHYPIDIKELED